MMNVKTEEAIIFQHLSLVLSRSFWGRWRTTNWGSQDDTFSLSRTDGRYFRLNLVLIFLTWSWCGISRFWVGGILKIYGDVANLLGFFLNPTRQNAKMQNFFSTSCGLWPFERFEPLRPCSQRHSNQVDI